jgi:hypothetical protein
MRQEVTLSQQSLNLELSRNHHKPEQSAFREIFT